MSASLLQIADFGLSRDLQREDFYLSHGGKIPVKWTAPEALQYRLYSPASDAWSYGVVLYEIWSLGSKPYLELTNEQVSIGMNIANMAFCENINICKNTRWPPSLPIAPSLPP